jgi:integrase
MVRRKRRGNGEGSVYQRADGRWCATHSVGYAPNGRRRRQTIFGESKEDVQNQLASVRSKMLEDAVAEPSKLRLATFLERWLEDAARPTVRATTHASYKGVIENHIVPRIGGVMLTKLSPIHVQALYSDMEREGKSPRLRQLTHAVLRRALKQALRWGLLPRNVCDAVDPPRVPKTEVTALTADQVQALLKAARNSRLYALFVLAIGSGMRLGEMFALQWRNVDLKNARLQVRHTLMELKGRLTLAEPKTPKSRRRIDLPLTVVEALKAHRLELAAEGHGDGAWVFYNSKGGPLRRSHFHFQVFKPLVKKAKLPDMRFHDLRHTSASLLLAAGVHPKVVQERLGRITLDTYSHVLRQWALKRPASWRACCGCRRRVA